MNFRRSITIAFLITAACGLIAAQTAGPAISPLHPKINCDERGSGFCLDRYTRVNYEGEYVGHDEPAVLFYSGIPGSGNHMIYQLILPSDPPVAPRQDGSGGTFNFELHPTFWFGMALCDSQSAPNPDATVPCVPNSDVNVFENTNSRAPDYIGKHPGTAFLELQFYPPGWIGSPGFISPTQYSAALNIDSFSFNQNTNRNNNLDCLRKVGQEPVNFATITKDGVPFRPANPLGTEFGTANPDFANVLWMKPGDVLRVEIQDSPGGVLITIQDLTTGQSGHMVGGPQAGFGQVDFNPAAAACTVTPYAFHPMYSTSTESTRVPWSSHSYNISFSDEIGHFELCNAFNTNPKDPNFMRCISPGPQDATVDADDVPCASPSFFGLPAPPFQDVIGCIAADVDFDGLAYGLNWPGTGNPLRDALYHPGPIRFTSPKFTDSSGQTRNYERVAFETDLPSIEGSCNVRDGVGCVNPPPGAQFYPIFSTTTQPYHQYWWQLGGPDIPGTVNTFGGTSAAEYGDLLTLAYPTPFGAFFVKGNFQRSLGTNPCQAP